MGAMQRFIIFGAGSVAMFGVLKSMDGLLYSYDEK
jgi:hypothetical protein